MPTHEQSSAANRFGLGARPGELDAMGRPRAWLMAQLDGDPHASAFKGLPGSLDYLRREAEYRQQRAQQRRNGKPSPNFGQHFRQARLQELQLRHRVALSSEAGFFERLVRFWSNHFAISVDKQVSALYAAPMEREAIRPHVLGRFSEMLIAAGQHPGMLRYLDNVRSVGEQSHLAQRAARREGSGSQRRLGLNENLAREILELHTLGVDGGYSQADVIELARAITGWGVPRQQDWQRGSVDAPFLFRAAAHDGGARRVLGRRYPEGGQAQGVAILQDLARHPATARHLCLKLARHFVSDEPPPPLVARMAQVWQREDGDLRAVYRSLIESEEAWQADARKFKTPDDFVLSALRAGNAAADARTGAVLQLLTRMGQPPFTPRSPAGFADEMAQWSGADALWKRVQAAQSLAEMAPQAQPDPVRTAQAALGDSVDAALLTALRRAESPREGLALLFASPSFQWRS